MIIDIHTHTFPEKIAERTLQKLAGAAKSNPVVDGTAKGLQASMKKNGVDYSIVLPVVTRPGQEETVNNVAVQTNETSEATGLISFGGIHPDTENYKEIIRGMAKNGIKGIKIHPVYQQVYFNDIRFKRIIDCAMEEDLAVITHAGYDIGFPGAEHVIPKYILPVIDELKPHKLILAHTGGWVCWEEVLSDIAGANVYFDTAFSLNPVGFPIREEDIELAKANSQTPESLIPAEGRFSLSTDLFKKIVEKHGSDKILFGSDSPWSDQKESIEAIKNSGISSTDADLILGENAKKLLSL